jgi:hypothetical protein
LVRTQERFLRHVLGVGRISQDAIGDLKDAPLIFGQARAKSCLAFLGFRSRNQSIHARTRPPGRSGS